MSRMKTIIPNMLLVAISRYGKIIVPHEGTIVQPDDGLYLMGNTNPL